MAQQIIDVGAAAEDHTGDELRIAFQKAVANFAELYAKADLLNFDEFGNLIANVTMRTGTYANLIGLSGSLGELGVCTDINAIIKFNGVAGQAKAFYRSRVAHGCECGFAPGTNVLTGATPTRLPFFTFAFSGDPLIDGSGYGVLPSDAFFGGTGQNPIMQVKGYCIVPYAADVTRITFYLYAETALGSGVYTSTLNQVVPLISRASLAERAYFDFNIGPEVGFPSVNWIPGVRWYLAATHSGAGSVSVNLDSFYDVKIETKVAT
jgi:hypothetical protein